MLHPFDSCPVVLPYLHPGVKVGLSEEHLAPSLPQRLTGHCRIVASSALPSGDAASTVSLPGHHHHHLGEVGPGAFSKKAQYLRMLLDTI